MRSAQLPNGRADALPRPRDPILAAVVGAPVRATRITPFGVLYDVVVLTDATRAADS